MNNNPQLAKIRNRLSGIARTAHQLALMIESAEVLPPVHEMRLSTKLIDMNEELQNLLDDTRTIIEEQ